ncbi:hypothetical protein I7I51_02060 [Histoplasma capsulatum]|uniref:Uncharacterized protein n=1 Tax=Ajellomyces capsulatus TaxID=5037 RepID=A0A8A1MK90_AJECA|nr:hypothetical protein I7I51_02060 [Histoplasma capsulatum]
MYCLCSTKERLSKSQAQTFAAITARCDWAHFNEYRLWCLWVATVIQICHSCVTRHGKAIPGKEDGNSAYGGAATIYREQVSASQCQFTQFTQSPSLQSPAANPPDSKRTIGSSLAVLVTLGRSDLPVFLPLSPTVSACASISSTSVVLKVLPYVIATAATAATAPRTIRYSSTFPGGDVYSDKPPSYSLLLRQILLCPLFPTFHSPLGSGSDIRIEASILLISLSSPLACQLAPLGSFDLASSTWSDLAVPATLICPRNYPVPVTSLGHRLRSDLRRGKTLADIPIPIPRLSQARPSTFVPGPIIC